MGQGGKEAEQWDTLLPVAPSASFVASLHCQLASLFPQKQSLLFLPNKVQKNPMVETLPAHMHVGHGVGGGGWSAPDAGPHRARTEAPQSHK